MNLWLKESIEYANTRAYLDDLFTVYPVNQDRYRTLDEDTWSSVEAAFTKKRDGELIKSLLKLHLFPIKNSYVAFLKRDQSAIARNPKTVKRIARQLYDIGLDKLRERSSEPKEANRQMGPMFKEWLKKDPIGFKIATSALEFEAAKGDVILIASDQEMKSYAKAKLNYRRDKGVDFIAKKRGRHVIGEAKFLTDEGGHQNAQLKDALANFDLKKVNAEIIAILDGVVYIKKENTKDKQMLRSILAYDDKNVMSALLLRDFLHNF